jgi:death-on-curing protein
LPKSKPRSSRHYRVTLGDVLESHHRALQFGGLDGVRDLGLVESAIARPYSGYYRSINAKAAALTHSLAKNHGFVDGNKRTALLTVLLFVARSGYRVTGHTVVTDAERMILDVVENRMTFEELVEWFRFRLVRT